MAEIIVVNTIAMQNGTAPKAQEPINGFNPGLQFRAMRVVNTSLKKDEIDYLAYAVS